MEVLTNQEYNQMFTMHGTTIVFLVIMPLSAAFLITLCPQIGARDVAFPRMIALSLWCFIGGGIILNLSWFFTGGSPAIGWFGYAPSPTLALRSNRRYGTRLLDFLLTAPRHRFTLPLTL